MNEIVKEYSSGLFALAAEERTEDAILGELRLLAPLFTDEYVHLLINPNIPKDERIALVAETLDGRVDPYVASFVKLLTERGLATEIKDCFKEYERLWYENSGVVRVTAESTVPLTDAQREKLEKKLSSHIGHPVEVTYVINRALLGGMRISYDNKLIDDSAATKLREIGERLSGVVL